MRALVPAMLLSRGLAAVDSSTFAYDRSLPLDVREHEVAVRDGIRVTLVVFAVVPRRARFLAAELKPRPIEPTLKRKIGLR